MTVDTPVAGSGEFDRRIFFASLIMVSAVPLFLLPFHDMSVPAPVNGLIYVVWIAAGYSHVMSTVWFGLDTDYHPLIARNKARMLGSLAVLPAAMAAIALASLAAASWAYAAYTLWLAHHYNRQNFGLVAFAAANDRLGPMPREVGWMFNLTTVAGAIRLVAMPTIYPGGISPFGNPIFAYYGQIVAALFMAAALILLAVIIWRHKAIRRSPLVLVFLGIGFAFYLPALVSGPNSVSFWPYAIAYGLQYLLMMGVVSRGSRLGLAGLGIAAGIALVLGMLVYSMSAAPWAQLYVGVVMWHFLVDARLWRLRDPLVRTVVMKRFSFLFERWARFKPDGGAGGRSTRRTPPRPETPQ